MFGPDAGATPVMTTETGGRHTASFGHGTNAVPRLSGVTTAVPALVFGVVASPTAQVLGATKRR
jgi:hypothetical protein